MTKPKQKEVLECGSTENTSWIGFIAVGLIVGFVLGLIFYLPLAELMQSEQTQQNEFIANPNLTERDASVFCNSIGYSLMWFNPDRSNFRCRLVTANYTSEKTFLSYPEWKIEIPENWGVFE